MSLECNTRLQYAWLVFLYIKLWIEDMVDYYHTLLILLLPSHLFDQPIIHITQKVHSNDNSDSEDSECAEEIAFDVFISKLELELEDHGEKQLRSLHGLQLTPFIDEMGKFYISNIETYFPTLTKINLNYIKYERYNNLKIMYDVTRVIDTKKKMDIHNNQSCRLGVVL